MVTAYQSEWYIALTPNRLVLFLGSGAQDLKGFLLSQFSVALKANKTPV